MSLRHRFLRFLRVPHEPSAPAGDANVRVFLASPNFFWYRTIKLALTTLVGAIGLFFAFLFTANLPLPEWFGVQDIPLARAWVERVWMLVELVAVLGFMTQAVISFILLRLDFEQRWYIVTDRSLRIREGIVKLHEKTMTFANIQEVSIRQGPFQRLLRIADLRVRTAGGGGSTEGVENAGSGMHIAYFRGISNAAAVRDVILDRLREFKDAGLGDPDEKTADTLLVEAAHGLVEEARALKSAGTPYARALPR